MTENNVTKHLSKLLHYRVGEFCVRFGRFWGYLLFLDPNCYFLLILKVCQLLEQLTLQVQLKLPCHIYTGCQVCITTRCMLH